MRTVSINFNPVNGLMKIIALAALVWRPSVCLSHLFPTLMRRAEHTQRDSLGGSTRRGQRAFLSSYITRTDITVN